MPSFDCSGSKQRRRRRGRDRTGEDRRGRSNFNPLRTVPERGRGRDACKFHTNCRHCFLEHDTWNQRDTFSSSTVAVVVTVVVVYQVRVSPLGTNLWEESGQNQWLMTWAPINHLRAARAPSSTSIGSCCASAVRVLLAPCSGTTIVVCIIIPRSRTLDRFLIEKRHVLLSSIFPLYTSVLRGPIKEGKCISTIYEQRELPAERA